MENLDPTWTSPTIPQGLIDLKGHSDNVNDLTKRIDALVNVPSWETAGVTIFGVKELLEEHQSFFSKNLADNEARGLAQALKNLKVRIEKEDQTEAGKTLAGNVNFYAAAVLTPPSQTKFADLPKELSKEILTRVLPGKDEPERISSGLVHAKEVSTEWHKVATDVENEWQEARKSPEERGWDADDVINDLIQHKEKDSADFNRISATEEQFKFLAEKRADLKGLIYRFNRIEGVPLGLFTELVTLDIEHCYFYSLISPDFSIIDELKALPKLRHLNIMGISNFPKDQFTAIVNAGFLSELQSFKTDRWFEESDPILLSQVINKLANLKTLFLHHCRINDDVEQAIAARSLESLDLTASPISEKMMETIGSLSELRNLSLERAFPISSSSDIDPQFSYIAPQLRRLTKLEHLNCAQCFIDPRIDPRENGVKEFVEALRGLPIRSLNIRDTDIDRYVPLQEIVSMTPELENLTLTIGDYSEITQLTTALGGVPQLRSLNLEIQNKKTVLSDLFTKLSDPLMKLTLLESLSISWRIRLDRNQETEQSIALLKDIPQLQRLSFAGGGRYETWIRMPKL